MMMGTLGGGGGERNPLGTAGPGGDLQRIQGIQNHHQFQNMFSGGIFDNALRSRRTPPIGGPSPYQGPQDQRVMMGTLGGGGGEKNPLGTAGPGGYLQRFQGIQFGGNPNPIRNESGPARPPQGGYNRGINPGGMYTGGQGGGFGSPFGGSMRGRQQPMPSPQPQYGGGFGGGYGGGMGGGYGGGFGMPSPPNMGYGNRFPGMQFSGPFAQPMMPQNYGMGGGFGGGYPMPQPRYPMPQPRMPYPQFPTMGGGMGGGYGGGMSGGYGGGYGGMFGGY